MSCLSEPDSSLPVRNGSYASRLILIRCCVPVCASISCVMERPKLRKPDAYHAAEPAWLPKPILPLCYVGVIMWRSRAMPIIDLWFIARVPWELMIPVRVVEYPR